MLHANWTVSSFSDSGWRVKNWNTVPSKMYRTKFKKFTGTTQFMSFKPHPPRKRARAAYLSHHAVIAIISWTALDPPPTLLSGKLIFSCNSAWIPPHTKNKKERNLLLQFSWNITNLKCWCQPSQMGYVANGCGFDADDKRPCLFEDTWKHCITLDPAQWLFVEAVFRQGGTIHKFIQAQK